MKILSIRAETHWGYSIKIATTGKAQPAHIIPPPSTLIGAISQPIARQKDIGETILNSGKTFGTTSIFQPIFLSASCKLIGKGTYWEDINRYIIALFQNKTRRFDQNYRFNAIPAGKVYSPNQKLKLVYLIDENAAQQVLGDKWQEEILIAAYGISRIGSKESITSVEDVKLRDAKEVKGKLTTSLYFPADSASIIRGEFFFADFWPSDYEFGKELTLEKYIVPASRAPIIESSDLQVDVKNGLGYTDGEDSLIVASR